MTLDEETDADLVLRARNGDDRAFTRLMRRHNPPLYGFVRRYIADADAAVDVVQETFVAAWKALARNEGVERRYWKQNEAGRWARDA